MTLLTCSGSRLSSNAIPATLWLLCHLISPSQRPLLNKILAELETAKRPGGHIDVNTLLTAPYLNSSLTETLRVYVDTLVTRELQSDMVICGHDLRKGELVMAPSYLGHHDGAEWSGEGDDAPSEAEWWGERFLKTDEKTGEVRMSTKDFAGKYFPFGGGMHMCGKALCKMIMTAATTLSFLFRGFCIC